MDEKNCAIVGAGIIGLCCGISLIEQGCRVTLYDPEPPGSMTSKGNAGGFGFTDVMPMASPGILKRIPGWLLDPCGPLYVHPAHVPKLIPWLWRFYKAGSLTEVHRISRALSDLLEASKADTRTLLRRARLHHLFTESGAITVYKSKANALKDNLEWEIKKSLGVKVVTLKTREEIKEMEPSIQNVNYGFYTPDWCNTPDPYEVASRLSGYFSDLGGDIVRTRIAALNKRNHKTMALVTSAGHSIKANHVIVAAGIWSRAFCRQLGDRILLESERGYNTTLPNPGVFLNRQIAFAEERFVITNIGNGLRIGGAVEFSGIDRPPNYNRSDRLVEIAKQYLPELDDSNGEKWMGHRPSTPDSIPVIGRSGGFDNVYYAFGHGHYGLTMAATTGKLISQLVCNQPTSINLKPFSINRFSTGSAHVQAHI